MERALAMGALATVTLVIILLIARANEHTGPRPPVRAVSAPVHYAAPTPARPILARGSADGGGYFDPYCPAPLHWVMAASQCVPPWRPDEP